MDPQISLIDPNYIHCKINFTATSNSNNTPNEEVVGEEEVQRIDYTLPSLEYVTRLQQTLVTQERLLAANQEFIQSQITLERLKAQNAKVLFRNNIDAPNANSTMNVDAPHNIEDATVHPTTLHDLNMTFQTLQRSISDAPRSSKVNVKRDYKLTQKTSLNTWLDYLRSELKSNDLLDLIDDNETPPLNETLEQRNKRNGIVRDIIINRLDGHYHRKILKINDSKEIIEKLKEFKKIEYNVSDANIRFELYNIRKGKKEKLDDFNERFDAIIRKYDSCGSTIPLSEVEITSAFYNAVTGSYPELKFVSVFKRQQEKKDLSIDEIKNYILQLEREKKLEKKKEKTTVNLAKFDRNDRRAEEEVKIRKLLHLQLERSPTEGLPIQGNRQEILLPMP